MRINYDGIVCTGLALLVGYCFADIKGLGIAAAILLAMKLFIK